MYLGSSPCQGSMVMVRASPGRRPIRAVPPGERVTSIRSMLMVVTPILVEAPVVRLPCGSILLGAEERKRDLPEAAEFLVCRVPRVQVPHEVLVAHPANGASLHLFPNHPEETTGPSALGARTAPLGAYYPGRAGARPRTAVRRRPPSRRPL